MGARLPAPTISDVGAKIHDHYRKHAHDWRRDHLGASVVGHECDRWLWLGFRWAASEPQDGRMLRLFRRGEREETWILEDLRSIGIEVSSYQRTVTGWGHIGGTCDAVVVGVPDDPEKEHVAEFKTFSRKNFDRLVAAGVRREKWQHFVQMQLYMLGLRLTKALYVAVCKDDDRLHTEIVDYDPKVAGEALARAQRIVGAEVPPERLDSASPPCVLVSREGERYPCRFFDLCHGNALPAPSCRTCVSATPRPDGSWHCAYWGSDLDGYEQRKGCASWLPIPAIGTHQVLQIDEAKRRMTLIDASGKRTTFGEEVARG